jgi:hypothetical protein
MKLIATPTKPIDSDTRNGGYRSGDLDDPLDDRIGQTAVVSGYTAQCHSENEADRYSD